MMMAKWALKCDRGGAAIELALLLPLAVLLCFGGYDLASATAVSRKVTITARALADLTSQYATMSTADMSTVINASTQIMAPYASAPLTIRISEITTDNTGLNATVTWSVGQNQNAYVSASPIHLPAGMNTPNTSYIFSEVGYAYKPVVNFVGLFRLSDQLYMLPRVSPTVQYPG